MKSLLTALTDMQRIPHVEKAIAFSFDAFGERLLVAALGSVNSSGWSHIRLSERYYITPPADGIWEIDLLGDPPFGPSLSVMLPVAATKLLARPDWVKGVRIIAAGNSVEAMCEAKAFEAGKHAPPSLFIDAKTSGRGLVEQTLAVYDDSWQPIGFCDGFPPHIKMKKLRHELVLIVDGADEGNIRRCINEAAAAGLIAAIIAAFVTGGAALEAALSAFVARLEGCLADAVIKIDNRSHWIEWCT